METKPVVLPLVTLLVAAVVSVTGEVDNCPGRKPNVGCSLDVLFQGVRASCNRIPASSVTSAPTVKWPNALPSFVLQKDVLQLPLPWILLEQKEYTMIALGIVENCTVKGEVFVLLMVDPDAPSPCPAPPAYYVHWLVTARMTISGVVQPVETYVEYAPPTPPQGTHRYQLLLYRLPARALPLDAVPRRRSGFRLENFARATGLGLEPEASFQFLYRP